MGSKTQIQWCDMTFNSWIGCTKVSPGCANCYAERDFDLRKHVAKWGAGQPRHRTSASYWKEPQKWNHHAPMLASGERPRVFCASLADWLDDEVPVQWLADLLDLIRRTPNIDWLLLTKRPQNWEHRILLAGCVRDSMPDGKAFGDWVRAWRDGTAPANVWIGTTVEDQARADERIPELLKIPAAVRFLSAEPLLGPVNVFSGSYVIDRYRGIVAGGRGIDWVICGGESGPKARPMHPDWARSLRDQCAAAGVPFLFKQWGEFAPVARFDAGGEMAVSPHGAAIMNRVGKHAAGRLLDGREHNEFPA